MNTLFYAKSHNYWRHYTFYLFIYLWRLIQDILWSHQPSRRLMTMMVHFKKQKVTERMLPFIISLRWPEFSLETSSLVCNHSTWLPVLLGCKYKARQRPISFIILQHQMTEYSNEVCWTSYDVMTYLKEDTCGFCPRAQWAELSKRLTTSPGIIGDIYIKKRQHFGVTETPNVQLDAKSRPTNYMKGIPKRKKKKPWLSFTQI